MRTSERSQSVWKVDTSPPEYPPLSGDARADVCIVGAGIAGMTTAYLLAKEGKQVIVLDDNGVGGGETAQSTAHLASEMDDRYYEIERLHGEEGSRLTYGSHQAAIEKVGEIAREEGIECGYRKVDAYLFLAPEHGPDELDRELEAVHRAGFRDAARVERLPLSDWDSGPALRFPRQAHFDPLAYTAGLARAVQALAGRVHTGTHVDAIEGGSPARVRTSSGATVTADAVVVATNSPINDRVAIHTKQAPYRTYVIGMTVPAGAVPAALYWDTADPYRYVRLQHGDGQGVEGTDVLLVGGEDHKTGHADDAEQRFARLEAWARARFKSVGEVAFRWSGQVMEPVDYLGYIGRDPEKAENVYIATGDSGQGTTHGTIAGMLLTDLIQGRSNPWEKLYEPTRRAVGTTSALAFVKENLDVATKYTEWVQPGDVDSEEEIPLGAGAVVRRGARMVAVYRDTFGELHEHSAACTHLGCIVHWNSQEMSWDCPCHGSRFNPTTGEVLNGPALTALRTIEESE
jgi:glycine/D-amino acid oxidase-like deaminating enzyme/nitrite reductase/ring-hydroxylating ferredoxin subunit